MYLQVLQADMMNSTPSQSRILLPALAAPCGSVIAPAFSCRLLFQTAAMKKPNTTLMRTDDELSGQEATGGPAIFKNSSGIK